MNLVMSSWHGGVVRRGSKGEGWRGWLHIINRGLGRRGGGRGVGDQEGARATPKGTSEGGLRRRRRVMGTCLRRNPLWLATTARPQDLGPRTSIPFPSLPFPSLPFQPISQHPLRSFPDNRLQVRAHDAASFSTPVRSRSASSLPLGGENHHCTLRHMHNGCRNAAVVSSCRCVFLVVAVCIAPRHCDRRPNPDASRRASIQAP
jgi:hypothetical protein